MKDYAKMIRSVPTKDLLKLAETFLERQSLNDEELEHRNLINAEMERRIAEWEVQ